MGRRSSPACCRSSPGRQPPPGCRDYDEDSDAAMRMMVEQQIESQSGALFLSGRLYDDGVIDPRDTRTVLGLPVRDPQRSVKGGRRLRRLPDVRRT
ncbi:hypothetical protein Nm8I071_08180 [Nonomuraea sp. TT08I-71]|nr:hypothetical protein Nm8I071_08180 [Nonomuraea sp. TT08I-71]